MRLGSELLIHETLVYKPPKRSGLPSIIRTLFTIKRSTSNYYSRVAFLFVNVQG